MPFKIFQDKVTKKWKISKPEEDNKVISVDFKTRESALTMAKRWMEYRNYKIITVKGNIVSGTS